MGYIWYSQAGGHCCKMFKPPQQALLNSEDAAVLQDSVGAKCKVAQMKISTSKFKAIILSWKKSCSFPLREKTLIVAEKFNYLESYSRVINNAWD